MTERSRSVFGWVGVAVRWALGALFIYMGLSKALDPAGFLKLVREYDLVTHPLLLNVIAACLPWVEVFCGLLLVLGVAVRGTALLLIAMLLPFTALVLHRALGIAEAQQIAFCAVRFDCGCGAGVIFICHKLVENSLLTLSCAWLAMGAGRNLCVWHGLANPPADAKSSDDSALPARHS